MTKQAGTRLGIALLMSAAALSVASCGQGGDGKAGAPKSVAAAGGNEATQNKFSLYTDAFNDLIDDFFGIQKNYNDYVEENIPAASATSSISFSENISTLERSLAKLREGRALAGGPQAAKADAAVDALLTEGDKLLAQWKTLDTYYESKAYRDDNLAKGKAAHPALMSAYEGTLGAIKSLDAALTEHLRARDAARVVEYQRKGNTAAYNVLNTMQLADLFSSAVIEGNTAEADRLLPLVVAANAELHKTEAATAAGADNKVEYDLISGYIDGMIGDYRDFKQDGDQSDRGDVVEAYNNAVEQMNDIEFAD